VIRAWNARTGAALWTFHLVAQPGDPNHKTWENDAWKTIGGTNTWGFLSADIERGIVYIPVSIAGSDYVGVERPGDNLYGTSLVAVDIATGQRKWHQQFVHHDIWDFDLAAAPTLFDAVKDGKTIPAVAEVTKMGMLFMFDRVTGEPLFGMEERPVPQSSVPGEKTSPTQPFPLKPPPLARISLKKTELPSSISPELASYCAGLWEKYKLEDTVPYTPWRLNQDIVMFPGAVGGGNWQGVAYNRKLGLIITNVMNAGQWGHLDRSSTSFGRYLSECIGETPHISFPLLATTRGARTRGAAAASVAAPVRPSRWHPASAERCCDSASPAPRADCESSARVARRA